MKIVLPFILLIVILFIEGCAKIGIPSHLEEPLKEPALNALTTIDFNVNDRWNDQGIELISGNSYSFQASANNWCDGGNPSKPVCDDGNTIPSSLEEGWKTTPSFFSKILKPMHWLRRCPKQPWYALVGVIRESKGQEHCFLIGGGRKEIQPEVTGRLFVFANDSFKWTYSNNIGVVNLSITRIK